MVALLVVAAASADARTQAAAAAAVAPGAASGRTVMAWVSTDPANWCPPPRSDRAD